MDCYCRMLYFPGYTVIVFQWCSIVRWWYFSVGVSWAIMKNKRQTSLALVFCNARESRSIKRRRSPAWVHWKTPTQTSSISSIFQFTLASVGLLVSPILAVCRMCEFLSTGTEDYVKNRHRLHFDGKFRWHGMGHQVRELTT